MRGPISPQPGRKDDHSGPSFFGAVGPYLLNQGAEFDSACRPTTSRCCFVSLTTHMFYMRQVGAYKYAFHSHITLYLALRSFDFGVCTVSLVAILVL